MPQGLLYKWEKNSGLDHKCGICKTVLSSPRAKKTCFGVHEEVCPKYHFTLFYIGNANKCEACRKSAELHDKRHREIAALILKIEDIDETDQAVLSPILNGKRKTKRSDDLEYFQAPRILERNEEEDEWADTSTLNDGDELEKKRSGTVGMQENCLPATTNNAKRKDSRKPGLLQIVTPALMARIHAALHPDGHLLEDKSNRPGCVSRTVSTHRIIRDNVGFNTHCFKPASMRQTVHDKKLLKTKGIGNESAKVAQDEIEMTMVLEQLGIVPNPITAAKERTNLLKQLRSIIRDDLDKDKNENRDTMMRMAGYWRYVNRKTYNYMVRENKIWDWATGQKLEEVEEDEGSEADTEDERDTVNAVWDDSSTVGTPLSGAGTPQKEVEDYTTDYNFDETESSQADTRMGMLHAKLKNCSQGQYSREEIQTSKEIPRKLPETSGRPGTSSMPPEKDSRHFERLSTIATHKHEEPGPFKPPPPASTTSQALGRNGDAFSAPHRDPNNRYHALTNLKGGLNQRLGRTSSTKALKIAPLKVSPTSKTTDAWTTVKGKAPGPGKRSMYAGALKKKTC